MPPDCADLRFVESLRFSELNMRYGHIPTREIARNIASNRHLKTVRVDEELTLENRRLIYEALYENESIQRVIFHRVDPTKPAFRLCQRIKNLKEMEIWQTWVADPSAAMFQLNRTLQKIFIRGGNMGDAAAQAVERSLRFRSCLRIIEFTQCTLSSDGLASIGRSLQQHLKLEVVKIYESNLVVEDEAASVLAQGIESNASMQQLHLHVNRVHAAGWERFICALTSNETLKEDHLTISELGAEEAIEGARLLKANKTLEKLHLCGRFFSFSMVSLDTNHPLHIFRLWNLDMDMIRRVCGALVSNDTIEHLVLQHGEITADGIVAIGHMFSNNSTLTSLAMSFCQIDDDKAVALFESLMLGQSLDSLDLSSNRIGNRRAAAAADFVASNQMIKKLDISHNSIGDDGFGALGRALEYNVSLEELFLTTHSYVSDRATRAILDGVKAHPVIKVVHLKGFLIMSSHQDELDFYLERNKGPKRILHANLPLSIWPLVLKRADDCRQVGIRVRAPDMLYYFVKEKSELFARGPSSRKRKRTSA